MGAALEAGCTCVVKLDTPLSTLALVELADQAVNCGGDQHRDVEQDKYLQRSLTR